MASEAEVRPSEPPAAAPAPAPIATGSQHVCFICLLNDSETPDATWVNPCPCTLEAHEECMLQWVAEMEQQPSMASSRRKPGGGLRCPACNARIRIDEPFDPVVRLRDRLHRAYSRTSPLVLLVVVMSGGIAGSGWYGLTAMHVFAGPEATARWLGLQTLAGRPAGLPLWRWAPFWKLNFKIWALSLVGPALTIGRALQPLSNLVMVPASLLSGIILLARDEMPTWPPSPAWAMTLYPFVQFTYSNLYWEFFGSLEKRLNRALRGRPAEDEPPQQPARQRDAVQQGEQQGEQQQQQQQQQQGEEEEGLGAVLWGLGNAVVGLFRDEHEVVVQAEVVHVDDEHQDEFNEEDEDAQIEAELERLEREVVGDQAAAEEQGQEDRHEGQNEGAEAGAADGVVVAQPQQEGQAQDPIPAPPPPPPEENNNNNNRIANTTLTDIVNNVVTSLLYPCICFGMGELLRLTLPRRLVTRPSFGRPTGLLQERWGRSLAGGCLYVVLKDAFLLYAKYRRVYVKQHRKIRNVERRR